MLSNLPPGTTPSDLDRAMGEHLECPECDGTLSDGVCEDCGTPEYTRDDYLLDRADDMRDEA